MHRYSGRLALVAILVAGLLAVSLPGTVLAADFDEFEYFDSSDVNNDWSFWTDSPSSPGTNGYLMTRQTSTATGSCAGGVSGTSYTPSNDTGPCQLDSGTGFLFLENSGSPPYTPDRTFTRNTTFDATTYQANVSFSSNLNTIATEGAALRFQVNDGGGWTTEWEQVDNDGNGGAWTAVDIHLYNGTVQINGGGAVSTTTYGGSGTSYTSGNLDYRFVFVSGSTWGNDVAVDTVHVYGNIACSDSDLATITINPPTSGSTVGGITTITANIGTETANMVTDSMLVTISGTTGGTCDVTDAVMTGSTAAGYDYSWDTSLCGTATAETGITIDVRGQDPDCSNPTINAPQIVNITVDNTGPKLVVDDCGDCHPANGPSDGPRDAANRTAVGTHGPHVGTMGYACTECHIDNGTPASAYPQGLGHREGLIEMAANINGGTYSKGTSFAQVTNPTLGSCSSVACHDPSTALITASARTTGTATPTWGTAYGCDVCHDNPPFSSSLYNHSGVIAGACDGCHPHNGGNHAQHLDGTMDASASCTQCHNSAVSSPVAQGLDASVTQRREIVSEFAGTWSHKAADGGAVLDADCIVCHMEGDPSTGGFSGVHGDGYVDLRDPDTGLAIQGATHNGSNPGAYTSGGSGRFVRFSRNLASATLEASVRATMINQCLKCHDANGASHADARVAGQTAGSPFTGTGSVIDVNSQFDTANQSYHPVRGTQNNSYVDSDLMLAPFNQTTKTAGTTNQWGDLISCWDCHADPGDSGTITYTVTAHGGAETLRGEAAVTGTPSAANATDLCTICHDMVGNNNPVGHGPNSAATDLDRSEKNPYLSYGCNMCHSSTYSPVAGRRARAEDVHGSNVVPNSTNGNVKSGRWASGPDFGPVSFIRNSNQFDVHAPDQIGSNNYTPICMGGSNGDPECTRSGTEQYTVGGTY